METNVEFYGLLLELRRFFEDPRRNPLGMGYFLNQVAVRLPDEWLISDRRVIAALGTIPVESWWPERWGKVPISQESVLHNGMRLLPEVERELLKVFRGRHIDLETLTFAQLRAFVANDQFAQLRDELLELYRSSESEAEKDSIERFYSWLRKLMIEDYAVDVDRFQALCRKFGEMPREPRLLRAAFYRSAEAMQPLVHSGGMFVACRRCGWRAEGECGDPSRCPGVAGWTQFPYREELLLLDQVHMERVVIPGLAELDLYYAVIDIVGEENVFLWPALDRFDLYIVANGTRIAVDVKDWRSPAELGKGLDGDILDLEPYRYDVGIYAYPVGREVDYRVVLMESASDVVITNRFMSIAQVVSLVREYMR